MKLCNVIIVNYNTGNLLDEVVDSVYKNHSLNKVIVVDNNSNDNSMNTLKNHPLLEKHYRKHNHGFGASCNFGSRLSHSEFMLFLNPDCILGQGTIDRAIKVFSTGENIGVVGVKVNNPDGTEQRASRRRLPSLFRAIKTYTRIERLAKYHDVFAGVNLNHKKDTDSIQIVEAISGAFIMIKTSVFKAVNGFDEKYPMHFEDLDLFKRILDCGYKIVYDPQIAVTHHQGISSQSNPNVKQLKKQGLVRYFKQHGSFFSKYIIRSAAKYL